MNNVSKLLFISLVVLISACNKESATTDASSNNSNVESTALDMETYNNMKAINLLRDDVFNKEFIKIVPPSYTECLNSTLKGLRPLELDGNKIAYSVSNGSHADGWIEGYIQVSPDRFLDIGLKCSGPESKNFAYFTNRDTSKPPVDGFKMWVMNTPSSEKGKITLFDGKNQRELLVKDINADLLQNKASEIKTTVEEISISNLEDMQTVAGRLNVFEKEFMSRELILNNKIRIDIVDDFINLYKAFRYDDRDIVIITTGCSGTSCSYTNIFLLEIFPNSTTNILKNDSFDIQGDGQFPNVELQSDNKVKLSFENSQGKQIWFYDKGRIYEK